MNHAQFGAYGDQAGDEEPDITDDQAHQALTEITITFLETS